MTYTANYGLTDIQKLHVLHVAEIDAWRKRVHDLVAVIGTVALLAFVVGAAFGLVCAGVCM